MGEENPKALNKELLEQLDKARDQPQRSNH
jgi:hypothetical protein